MDNVANLSDKLTMAFRDALFPSFIALALIGLGAGGVVVYQIETSAPQNDTTTGYQPVRNAREGLPGSSAKPVAETYEPNCFGPKDAVDSALCAQWSSVETAEQANRLSTAQIKLNGLQFGALAVSLFFTGWAAFAASKAARSAEESTRSASEAIDIAERNAKAAQRQADISEDTAKRQLRAYVGIERLVVENVNLGAVPRAVVSVKNYGQTPAHSFDVLSHLVIAPIQSNNDLPPICRVKNAPSSLPPGGLTHAYPHLGAGLHDAQWQGFRNGTLAAFVYGLIEYTDTFGERRATQFRARYDRHCPPGTTLHCADGNEQT